MSVITAQFVGYIHEVEALDSWQKRALSWGGAFLWEDCRVKGWRALRRGLLAIAFNDERCWLYLWVSPEFQKFMLSFKPSKPMSRSKVDHWLTWNITSRDYSFLKGYNPDCLRRCRRILSQHPESVMPLMTPRAGGFPNVLWAFLAKEALGAV